MPDTFYRTYNSRIVTCNKNMGALASSLILARAVDNSNITECHKMLHRANTQPGLLEALMALLNEVEEAGNANADDYGWPTVVPQARAAIAAATAKGE